MPTTDKTDANIALVQQMYDAFGRNEIEKVIESCSEDVHWQSMGSRDDYPLLGHWDGRKGVAAFFAKLAEVHTFNEFTPQEFYGSGDHVFVLGHYALTVNTTGKSAEADFVHVLTLNEGQCTAFRENTDTAALATAWRR
jgi:ketosteroid isomerase-like protein